VTNTAISGARLYWESKLPYFSVKGVSIRFAVSAFPDEIDLCRAVGRSGRIPNWSTTTSSTKAALAAWEQPQLFSDEVRAGFRSLR